jgi:hypothetical protein
MRKTLAQIRAEQEAIKGNPFINDEVEPCVDCECESELNAGGVDEQV